MATTTPNFGWAVPTSTDLVKNGAVAIETLGDSIDASLVDLKGGTTGQVLKKNTNADMDFVWSADSAGMTNPMTTTGDTIYSSSGSTPARLGIGTTGQVLTVASGIPSWATPAGGGTKNFSLLNTGGTTMTGASTITISGISAQDQLFVIVEAASIDGGGNISIRFNADTGTNYRSAYPLISYTDPPAAGNFQSGNANTTLFVLARHGNASGNAVNGSFSLQGCNASGLKMFSSAAGDNQAAASGGSMRWNGGAWNNSATVTSISFISQNGNFDAGTVYVYGAA